MSLKELEKGPSSRNFISFCSIFSIEVGRVNQSWSLLAESNLNTLMFNSIIIYQHIDSWSIENIYKVEIKLTFKVSIDTHTSAHYKLCINWSSREKKWSNLIEHDHWLHWLIISSRTSTHIVSNWKILPYFTLKCGKGKSRIQTLANSLYTYMRITVIFE